MGNPVLLVHHSFSDARLQGALDEAAETERAIRFHLEQAEGEAAEQARGQMAYRHAVALRRALENWIETRAFCAAQEQNRWQNTHQAK